RGVGTLGEPADPDGGQPCPSAPKAHRARSRPAHLYPDRARGGVSLRPECRKRRRCSGAARSPLSRGRPPGRDGDAVMPVSRGAFGAALLVPLLMPPIQARGQAGRSTGASKRLAALRVGQWVQLEGSLRSDSTAVCTEVRLLTGDFLEDD